MPEAVYEASVEREFCASHALRLPDGSLEPVHGHNWRLTVTVARPGLDAVETVMDFHELEAAVDRAIEPWQNRHLNDAPPFEAGGYNPSAERVAQAVAEAVAPQLPDAVTLTRVSVTEAPGCVAAYRPAG